MKLALLIASVLSIIVIFADAHAIPLDKKTINLYKRDGKDSEVLQKGRNKVQFHQSDDEHAESKTGFDVRSFFERNNDQQLHFFRSEAYMEYLRSCANKPAEELLKNNGDSKSKPDKHIHLTISSTNPAFDDVQLGIVYLIYLGDSESTMDTARHYRDWAFDLNDFIPERFAQRLLRNVLVALKQAPSPIKYAEFEVIHRRVESLRKDAFRLALDMSNSGHDNSHLLRAYTDYLVGSKVNNLLKGPPSSFRDHAAVLFSFEVNMLQSQTEKLISRLREGQPALYKWAMDKAQNLVTRVQSKQPAPVSVDIGTLCKRAKKLGRDVDRLLQHVACFDKYFDEGFGEYRDFAKFKKEFEDIVNEKLQADIKNGNIQVTITSDNKNGEDIILDSANFEAHSFEDEVDNAVSKLAPSTKYDIKDATKYGIAKATEIAAKESVRIPDKDPSVECTGAGFLGASSRESGSSSGKPTVAIMAGSQGY